MSTESTGGQLLAQELDEQLQVVKISVLSTLMTLFMRDLRLALNNQSDLVNPLIFFLIVVSLFPLGVSPAPDKLAALAPGVLWVVALLATLLSTDSMFQRDYDDGSLALMLLSPQPLYATIMGKLLAHWCVTSLPLTLVVPLLGVLLNLPVAGMAPLFISLLLGGFSLSFVGGIGAALTVGLRRGGVLLSLIVLPLYTPVLIFGAGAVQSAIRGNGIAAELAVLGAFMALSISLAPLAIAAALRISVDN